MPNRKQSHYTRANKVELIKGGHEFFGLLESLLVAAERSIYFQIYIFDEDDTGKKIAKALIAAARRKVAVHLLLDAYASKNLSSDFIQKLKDAGVHFRWFRSFIKNKKFYFGRRLHHKVIVIDSFKSLVSGLNISDRYNDTVESKAWLDWALYTEGTVSLKLEEVCKKRIKDYSPNKNNATIVREKERCIVRIHINDWLARKSEITRSYLQMLKDASSHVIIMSPYFLPGYAFRRRLKLAAKKGVKIKLILAGLSDIALAKYAERYMYDWLLRNNIEIYEYQKNVLHGKIATCDGDCVTVGSYNINNLSAYASIELNMEVKDEKFASHVQKTLQTIIDNECVRITKKTHEKKMNFLKRAVQLSAYMLLRFMLFVITLRSKNMG